MRAKDALVLSKGWPKHDRDLSGRVLPDGHIRWFIEEDAADGKVFPLAIACLAAPATFPGCLLIQHRHPRNASSQYYRYSNVSGRVRLHDYLLARGKSNELDERAFRIAAAREVFEETGLNLDADLFHPHDAFQIALGERLAECRVFWVVVDLLRLSGSADRRSNERWLSERDLHPLTLDELAEKIAANRANTILSKRFQATFVPLFDKATT